MREPEAGLLGEFATPEALLAAVRELRAAGWQKLNAYTPYPVPPLEEALGLPRSSIPRWAFVMGLSGAALAYLIQWWTAAVDYPVLVGGMPAHSGPAFVPITFETMVLFAALTAFIGFFAKSGLPRLHHPVTSAPGFESAAVHRFWVGLDAADARFSPADSQAALFRLGALRVVAYGGTTTEAAS